MVGPVGRCARCAGRSHTLWSRGAPGQASGGRKTARSTVTPSKIRSACRLSLRARGESRMLILDRRSLLGTS